MRFTVFTPAYNRGYCIEKLFRSLQRQSFRDFEWVVVDDGSTDDTEARIAAFQKEEQGFPIRYQKVENGGKHRANNLGVRLARGELFTCVDSDDYLTDDALEIIDRVEKSIPPEEKPRFAGVCGQKCGPDLLPLKGSFAGPGYLDMTYIERLQNKIVGDCSEVLYTEVWRKYPYAEYPGENFLTEATALYEMAADGLKMRFFNQPIKIIEYLPDGLTASSKERFRKNPRGWGLYIYDRIRYGQLKGPGKWDVIGDYYLLCRDRLSVREMAEILHMNPVLFRVKLSETLLKFRLHLR